MPTNYKMPHYANVSCYSLLHTPVTPSFILLLLPPSYSCYSLLHTPVTPSFILLLFLPSYSCYSLLHTPVTPPSAPFSVVLSVRLSIQETGFHAHTRQLIFTVYIFIFTWYIAVHNNLFDIGCLTHNACLVVKQLDLWNRVFEFSSGQRSKWGGR
jgi:hypothetical protein